VTRTHRIVRAMLPTVAAVALLAGCATRYQEMGFTGGTSAEQMSADVFRIKSRGNGYTDVSTVQDYVLLKAAETTKSVGGTHFQVIDQSDATQQQIINTPGTVNTSVYGSVAFTTYSPPSSSIIKKPGQDVYIRVLRLPAGQQAAAGVFAADEIVQFIGGRVQRG
jgi:hypothetical protein